MIEAGAGRRGIAAIAAMVWVLGLGLTLSVGSAMAETGGSAPPTYDGDMSFPAIQGPTEPDEFSWRVELGREQVLRQADEDTVVVEYLDGQVAFFIQAQPAHDAQGANVPTSLGLSEGDVITLVVHDREGNPDAGGAPFVYPVSAGSGWVVISGESINPQPIPVTPDRSTINEYQSQYTFPPFTPNTPAASCSVPALHGLTLRAAKARLRVAHCSIGPVRLSPHATKAKGKVIRQSRPVGTKMAAGTSVAVKLGVL